MKSKITLLAMCITVCFALNTLKSVAQEKINGCPNATFEDTTFTGWTGATGNCSNYPTPTVWTPGIVSGALNDTVNDALSQHTLLTDPTAYDPIAIDTGTHLPAIPYLAPGGGNVSVRLGNSATNSGTEKLDYYMPVTAQNTSFTFMTAIVLENAGGHTVNQSPRFEIHIYLNGSTLLTGPCAVYSITSQAASTDPTFFPYKSGVNIDGYYKPWTNSTIDLTPYIGQSITVEFVTQDCTLGGHYGYAYIDASCGVMQNQVSFCPGSSMAILTAPSGFSNFQWYDSTGVAIPGSTHDTLQITNPVVGQHYTVAMLNSSGCGSTITTYLAYSTNCAVGIDNVTLTVDGVKTTKRIIVQ